MGDGAEVLDQLGAIHANAVVLDRESARALVGRQHHPERRIGACEVGIGQGQHAQLFDGVGGVGDQLTQEDVAVGIDRVHHEVEEARNFGLEGSRFGVSGGGVSHICKVFTVDWFGRDIAKQGEGCKGLGGKEV